MAAIHVIDIERRAICRDRVLLRTDLQTALRIVRLYVGAAECGTRPALTRGVGEDDTVLGCVQICRAGRLAQGQPTAVHLVRLTACERDRVLGSGCRDRLPSCRRRLFELAIGAAYHRLSARERPVDAVLLRRQAELARLTAYGCIAARDVDGRTIRRKCRRTGEMQLVLGSGRRRRSRLCHRIPPADQNSPLERAPVRP